MNFWRITQFFFFWPEDPFARLVLNAIRRAARMTRHKSVRIMKIREKAGAQMCKSLRSHQLWWIPGDFKWETSSVRRTYSVHQTAVSTADMGRSLANFDSFLALLEYLRKILRKRSRHDFIFHKRRDFEGECTKMLTLDCWVIHWLLPSSFPQSFPKSPNESQILFYLNPLHCKFDQYRRALWWGELHGKLIVENSCALLDW